MARSMACELGQKGIRVNSLSPGHIRTNLVSKFLDENPDQEEKVRSTASSLTFLALGLTCLLLCSGLLSTLFTVLERSTKSVVLASGLLPTRAPMW